MCGWRGKGGRGSSLEKEHKPPRNSPLPSPHLSLVQLSTVPTLVGRDSDTTLAAWVRCRYTCSSGLYLPVLGFGSGRTYLGGAGRAGALSSFPSILALR